MAKALITAGVAVELSENLPIVIDEIQYPSSILYLWTSEELAALSITDIHEPDPTPVGKSIQSSVLEVTEDNVVSRVVTYTDLGIERLKEMKRNAIIAKYGEVMNVGFPHDFGSGPETLQIVAVQDQLNWTILLTGCAAASAAGAGGQPVSPPFRCTSNNQYVITIDEAIALIKQMLGYGSYVLGNMWSLKNKVDGLNGETAPTTAAEVAAIDENSGWTPPS